MLRNATQVKKAQKAQREGERLRFLTILIVIWIESASRILSGPPQSDPEYPLNPTGLSTSGLTFFHLFPVHASLRKTRPPLAPRLSVLIREIRG